MMNRYVRRIWVLVLVLGGGVLGAGCSGEPAAETAAPEAGRCGFGSTGPECASPSSAELGPGNQGEWRSMIVHGKNGPEELHYQVVNGLAVFQGDIILGKAEELESKGSGVRSRTLRWPDRHVRYTIDAHMPTLTRNDVDAAILHWEENTDFEFEYVASPAPGTNYIRFKDSNWCASPAGMQGGEQSIELAAGRTRSQVVGMAIGRGLIEGVYTWYNDGVVTVGTRTALDSLVVPAPYTLPSGYTPANIVGMSFATSLGRVYTWYDNKKYSIGTPTDLGSIQGPTSYTLPSDYSASQIRGIGFAVTADPNDRDVYVWYDNGMRSFGIPSNLTAHNGPIAFSLSGKSASSIMEMDTTASGTVRVWFTDWTVYSGTSLSPTTSGPEIFTMPDRCTRGSIIHEIGHAVGLWHEHSRCDRDDYVVVQDDNIQTGMDYAFDKHCLDRDLYQFDWDSIMLYPSSAYSVDPTDPAKATMVRADNGATFSAQRMGLSTGDIRSIKELYGYSPPVNKVPTNIVGMAISSTDRVYTWYSNGQWTDGSERELGSLSGFPLPLPVTLPSGKNMSNIVAIAKSKSNDRVYAWYDDFTMSAGSTTNFTSHSGPQSYTIPLGMTPADIVEIAIAPNGNVYTWYDNHTVSIGTPTSLGATYILSGPYTLAPGKTPEMVVGIDFSADGSVVYAWYNDFTMSAGDSAHLDSIVEAW